jgi:UDP-N-acetylglucosamine--N-acetylmuramyl-(pentapeptide) pyrophosphoryl-undecaprenol N-acetylglucosamine transferase
MNNKSTLPTTEPAIFRKKSIVLAAGGTGGHLFPALALAEEFDNAAIDVHLITDLRCKKYLPANQQIKSHIFDFHLKMTGLANKVISLWRLSNVCIKTLLLVGKLKPDIIIGFGGYTSFPSLLAAKVLRIPFILQEQNCFLGKSNRLFAKSARIIALSYKETNNVNIYDNRKVVVTGDLVRSSIRSLPIKNTFDNEEFRLFIFGGSQGAKVFSQIIPEAITELLKLNPVLKIHITQQVSQDGQKELSTIYDQLGIKYLLSPFFHNIAEIYSETDLVISRSGASTVAELVNVGVPAIFIPFPYAMEDHQYFNAMAIETSKAGWCFRQEDVTPHILAQKIYELVTNRTMLKEASKNLLNRKNNGAKYLADTVLKIIG